MVYPKKVAENFGAPLGEIKARHTFYGGFIPGRPVQGKIQFISRRSHPSTPSTPRDDACGGLSPEYIRVKGVFGSEEKIPGLKHTSRIN